MSRHSNAVLAMRMRRFCVSHNAQVINAIRHTK